MMAYRAVTNATIRDKPSRKSFLKDERKIVEKREYLNGILKLSCILHIGLFFI